MNTSSSTTCSLDSLHPDILLTHILSRLDGPTLAAASSASSHLHSLSSSYDNRLWRSISASSWPSTSHPLVAKAISAFPSGHRSFFSDAYPVLDYSSSTPSSSSTSSLISAVDVHHMGKLVLSRVHEMETVSGWFKSSPFRIDLLCQNEPVPLPTAILTSAADKAHDELDGWMSHLERNLTMSWVLIDPSTKRAANVSSGRAVSVQRHWLTGEVQARYVAVIRGGGEEAVCVAATVTCWPKEGGSVEVREVSLQVEDMEGKAVSGEGSVRAIAGAMMKGRRKEGGEGWTKRRYEEYEVMKRACRERRQRRERLLDLACISVGVTFFVAFWCFFLFR